MNSKLTEVVDNREIISATYSYISFTKHLPVFAPLDF